jgi:hypothetical protein
MERLLKSSIPITVEGAVDSDELNVDWAVPPEMGPRWPEQPTPTRQPDFATERMERRWSYLPKPVTCSLAL